MNTSIFDNPRMFNFLNSRGLYIDLSAQACNGASVLSEDGGSAEPNWGFWGPELLVQGRPL